MECTVVFPRGQRAHPFFVEVDGTPDRPAHPDGPRDGSVAAWLYGSQQLTRDLGMWLANVGVTGGGHDGHERPNAVGVVDRERLGDHPAHGSSG